MNSPTPSQQSSERLVEGGPGITLTVRGTAHLEVPPDFADIRLAVVGRGADQQAAAHQAEPIIAGLREVLTAAEGITSKDLAQLTVTREQVWDDTTRSHIPGNWVARTNGSVRVESAHVNTLLTTLLDTGAHIEYVSWTLAGDNPAHRHARIAAVNDAARAAEDFAVAVHRPLGAMVSLSDPGISPLGSPIARSSAPMSAMADESAPNIALEPALIKVSAEVVAVFHTA